jgi:uncharacterized protein YqgV (UPF0045/DUF77 family)
VVHVEFTIEPFVEGAPGSHVLAAVASAGQVGVEVEMGPFGSTCDVPARDVGALVGAITDAAIGQGATHVSIHVEAIGDPASAVGEAE